MFVPLMYLVNLTLYITKRSFKQLLYYINEAIKELKDDKFFHPTADTKKRST